MVVSPVTAVLILLMADSEVALHSSLRPYSGCCESRTPGNRPPPFCGQSSGLLAEDVVPETSQCAGWRMFTVKSAFW